MTYFVVQFPLKTEKYQEDILDKRFEIGRQIYNSLVNITQKRYKELIKTKKCRSLISQLSGDKQKNKITWGQINDIRKQYGMSEYLFYKDVQKLQQHFFNNVDALTARSIASNLWRAYEELFYGNGEQVHYKKRGCFNSLEGQSNKQGIYFRDDAILWKGLRLPMVIDYNNYYENQALKAEIVHCGIVRKFIRNKYKYYVQITFKGNPPLKVNNETGEVKHYIGEGDVGIDIGTSTIAYSSSTDVKLLELADKVQNIEDEKRRLLRKMDRSRRATNPDNYNEDGTIKKQGNKRITWNKSNHYLKYQSQLQELYRKQTDVRKYQHECLANQIISLGDTIYVEKMNFSGLAKRSTKTEKNEKGRFKRKKRFGKSIANRAPAMLLEIINRKLSYFEKCLIRIDTVSAKASQFNHFNGTYNKKKLSQRWNDFNGIRVQRDLYSAFLIMNVAEDLKSFDINKCNKRFDNFYRLHNLEVERLTGHRNLRSIAI